MCLLTIIQDAVFIECPGRCRKSTTNSCVNVSRSRPVRLLLNNREPNSQRTSAPPRSYTPPPHALEIITPSPLA
ncbi:hypothetical protein BKA80DRAFT_284950 [Phyllosticta citrichinensis]